MNLSDTTLAPHLAGYKRQYIGLTIEGKQVLFMNFIYDDPAGRPTPSSLVDWKQKWNDASGGGGVIYNPVAGTFSDWQYNPFL